MGIKANSNLLNTRSNRLTDQRFSFLGDGVKIKSVKVQISTFTWSKIYRVLLDIRFSPDSTCGLPIDIFTLQQLLEFSLIYTLT